MENRHKLVLIVSTLSISFVIFIILALLYFFRRKRSGKDESWDNEASIDTKGKGVQTMDNVGELIRFNGGENLTSLDILDAPGEVIGKSSYGTLYKANLVMNDSVVCLRFLRPTCTKKVQELSHLVQLLGSVRHPNLVPLLGFYSGPRGEKLVVHPFYERGNLAQFINDGRGECHKWTVISTIATGIGRGLHYLHTELHSPIIHGNLKSKNILLDQNQHPVLSDFGLQTLLKPFAAQEMLESAAIEGYRAPELINMEDISESTDIYNFGLILLELITGKGPVNKKPNPDRDSYIQSSLRNAILNNQISDLYHPEILMDENNGNGNLTNEERVLRFFQLAMDCCSPSPSLRPNIKQICKKLEEM
uniref:probable leucine-rich repeat receptor-like protein kinase IMK3 n=1 Tax=Erigeron canadensis TaxID=72917 RepID=UPI001CB8E6B1|nr:probable leucine-rich repeat receptor-like protein kinase IMK3 [Erigeron canadensis]